MHFRKIVKFGGSYSVSIPKSIVREFGIEKGQYISISINEKNQIVLGKVDSSLDQGVFIPGIGKIPKYGQK